MVGFVIWIVGLVLTIKAALEIRQGTNAAMAGYWSSKILATSESNIYMNIILNMGEYSKSQ